MNYDGQDRDSRPSTQDTAKPIPGFKPVALPALAAAVQASKLPTHQPKDRELPAILRKEAILD